MTVGQLSDSRDIENTKSNELGDNEKVEIEESDSTLENENVTIAPNATIIPDPNSNEQNKNEQNKNEKIENNKSEQKIMEKSENTKIDNRPTKIDDARIVWTKLISNCLAIVRVAVDLFSSGIGFSKQSVLTEVDILIHSGDRLRKSL